MKVVALQCSSRINGNTTQLLWEIVDTLENEGVDVQWYNISKLNITGCQSCYGCKEQAFCVVQDDAWEILKEIFNADAVVFGTPVYMWDMPGQLKLVIDRMFSFLNDDCSSKLTAGKKMLWAVTQRTPDANVFRPYFEKSIHMLQMAGFGEGKVVIGADLREQNDICKQYAVLEKARASASWLLNRDIS
ncbi:MAG: flavodoxin family protein [Negativicutes bacterium]|jgi:multimeric flavodoxin WrbA